MQHPLVFDLPGYPRHEDVVVDPVKRKHHRLPTSMVFPAMSQLTAIAIPCKGRPFSSLAGLTGKKFFI
jgi:hypothetical protein